MTGAGRGLGPSHSLPSCLGTSSRPQCHQSWFVASAIADMAWSDSPAASSRDPGHFWTVPWFFSSPSEQRKQPFSLPAGRFAASAPAEGRPPSLIREAGLPPSLGPPCVHSCVHSRGLVDVYLPVNPAGQPPDPKMRDQPSEEAASQQCNPTASQLQNTQRTNRPASYCFQAGVLGWGPDLHRGFWTKPSTV